jgi:hypothetical protein
MTRTGSFFIGAAIPLVEGIRQTYDWYPAIPAQAPLSVRLYFNLTLC